MHQNKSILSSKGPKRTNSEINNLKNDLMSKISNLEKETQPRRPSSSKITTKTHSISQYSQYDDLEIIQLLKGQQTTKSIQSSSILQKAKLITQSNKKQLDRAKKIYKKSNLQSEGMFLTGCGLYKAQQPKTHINEGFQTVDMNDALKYLVSHEKDDLQELRRMIKKTSLNMKEIEKISRTKNHVVNAAGLFGKQMNMELRSKIGRYKKIENDFDEFDSEEAFVKRKISTSGKARTKKIN